MRKLMELMHAVICQLRKWSELVAAWQDQMDAWADRMDEFERRLDEFEKRLDEFEVRLDAVEKWLTELQKQVDINTQDIANIKTEISNIWTNITNLWSEIGNIKNQITDIYNRLTEINNHLTTIDNHLTTIDGQITTINNHLTTIDNQISTINNTITDIQNSINNINVTIDDHEDRIVELENRPIVEGTASRILVLGRQGDVSAESPTIETFAGIAKESSYIHYGIGGATGNNDISMPFEFTRTVFRAGDVVYIQLRANVYMYAVSTSSTITIPKGGYIKTVYNLGLPADSAYVFMPVYSAASFTREHNDIFYASDLSAMHVVNTIVPRHDGTNSDMQYEFTLTFTNTAQQTFQPGSANIVTVLSDCVDFILPAQYALPESRFGEFDNTQILTDFGWLTTGQQSIEEVRYDATLHNISSFSQSIL